MHNDDSITLADIAKNLLGFIAWIGLVAGAIALALMLNTAHLPV